MPDPKPTPDHTALRPPVQVMRLARLGSMHQCRLSFMRVLTRRMARENWRFSRPVFDIDAQGVGHAVYSAEGPDRTYSLIAFAHDLPAEKRSDRVIAEAWDATFTLFDGVPTLADIERLRGNIPLQEAGRVTESELSVSRANRSVRLWEHVVAALAAGLQPDWDQIKAVKYLMRTTAVYGSGKLGAADREAIADRAELKTPFQAEMLSVYLTRAFVRDLVQHMARARGGAKAVDLDPGIAGFLGIGNSTGLGLAPFLINHPVLFNNWVVARETALARVRGVVRAAPDEVALFRDRFARTRLLAERWLSQHPAQIAKLTDLHADLASLGSHLAGADLTGDHPWDRLYRWAEANLSLEGQECLASLLLEPYGGLVDDLADQMHATPAASFPIDGAMRLDQVRNLLETHYDWALAIDWKAPGTTARAWYVSEEKLEPRLGERFEEPIEPYEQPLAPGRDAARLLAALADWPDTASVADFLLRQPEHRHSLRRVQIVSRFPYAEIRDNTISQDVLPIDFLRFKLAHFGATHFDPRSDRWVRISMYGNAPYPEDLTAENADDWVYPDLPEGAG